MALSRRRTMNAGGYCAKVARRTRRQTECGAATAVGTINRHSVHRADSGFLISSPAHARRVNRTKSPPVRCKQVMPAFAA